MKNYKRKQEIVECHQCGIQFEKDSSEVKRNNNLGRRHFCSRSCSSKSNEVFKLLPRNTKNLNPSNRVDEFTGFREHLRRVKYRTKEVDLSLEDMLEVWNKQKGICIYSKVKLKRCSKKNINSPIDTMSLDRIDSSKGYTKDNIQFISIAMNHMKNSMTHEQTLELIEILKHNK